MADSHLSHDEVCHAACFSLSRVFPLTRAQFFGKLTDLFTSRKGSDHGSICLVQKRCLSSYLAPRPVLLMAANTSLLVSYNQDIPQPTADNPMPDLDPPHPFPVIIRATNAKSKRNRDKKVKLSTVVKPEDLDAFYARYADVCKAGMTALKPRDRSKKKAKAKKKKTGTAAGNAS